MPSNSIPPVAYSYIRFSTPEQEEGDSYRRQTEAARAWCERNKVHLDESVKLFDKGKSAYTGQHRTGDPDKFRLAAFLEMVKTGRVARGSYLIIESLDRLTREEVKSAVRLILELIEDHGLRIVQLSPKEFIYDESADVMELVIMLVELARGHGESKRKSDMISATWQQKKKAAQKNEPQPTLKKNSRVTGKKFMTSNLPFWLKNDDDPAHEKPVLIPKPAYAVKRIFQLAASGFGQQLICRQLYKEKIKPFGKGDKWVASYINRILTDRRALGEFQPCKDGKPDGPVLSNYFPAVVTQDEFDAAGEGLAHRNVMKGRISTTHVNLFTGLVRDALHGCAYVTGTTTKHEDRGGDRILVSSALRNGSGPGLTFPLLVFEEALLSALHEIDVHSILNGNQNKPDETVLLASALAQVEAKIGAIQAELLNTDSNIPSVIQALRKLEEQRTDAAAKLATARQKALHPVSEQWGECKSLLEALSTAPDKMEARLKLRSVLRRVIEAIYLVVVPRGLDRLAQVEIYFRDSERTRSYFIAYRPKIGNQVRSTPGSYYVSSIPTPCELPGGQLLHMGTPDLRDGSEAAMARNTLETYERSFITELLEKHGEPLPEKDTSVL
jgi:DNA invertase Pin-like site-specific DNA recombinase